MERKNECYAYFTLSGAFDPQEITARLGVQPTRAWRKGSLTSAGRARKNDRWSLYSRLGKDASLEEHVRDVLAQMGDASVVFVEVCSELGGHMQLVGYFYSEYSGLYFERDIVEGLPSIASQSISTSTAFTRTA